MREILERANLALLSEIDLLLSSLPFKENIANELIAYYNQIHHSCQQLRQKVFQSLADLKKGRPEIFIDILSNTQTYTREFHLYNYRLVTPILRYRPSDQLCLKIINWLHRIHPKTQNTPGAFCDAVGFQIGGFCFVNAFSMHLKMWGSDRFYLTFEKLAYSSHPVAWLRIKFLCEYLKQAGFEEQADQLTNEWLRLAQALSVKEDYFGFYNDEFFTSIMATIRDMLIETEPYQFKAEELADMDSANQIISPIQLLNSAWLKFHENPETYRNWEQEAISNFLNLFEYAQSD